MQKIELRELGLYALSDGRKFVVHANSMHGYSLYSLQAWENNGAAEYIIAMDGKLLSKGIPTRWGIGDLTDTGQGVEAAQAFSHS